MSKKKEPQYNQELVNQNMETLLDLPQEPRTLQDRMKNIIRSEVVVVDKQTEVLNNNQSLQTPVKKKGRGGARPNSGRKVGSTVKLSAADLLSEIERQDKPFAEGLAEDYIAARRSGDLHIVQRYQQMFLGKVLADKQEVDVTSNGQTMGVAFNFPTNELDDWK